MEHTYIVAPVGAKYLSEVPEMFDGLPKNCLFNKVTTGCGGTYVALTSSEPYIIAVPTKALVEDKIKSEGYANVKLLAVSGDYNFTNHEGKSFGSVPEGYTKIICTYQQLENVTRKVNPTDWHLLVDEMHLILRMASFCGGFLTYMMENFKQYKSYCFMSATIPREEWLLDELKVIPRVTMDWPSTTDVKFYGLKAESVKESLLQICDDHLTGKREGNAYFFYNSISGICSILRNLKKIPEVKLPTEVAGCSCITGVLENSTEAPPLSAATKAKYRRATVGVKTFREIADENPDRAKELDPELWSYYEVIGRKGFIACDHNKTKIKAKVKKEKEHSAFVPKQLLDAHFKVGKTYRTDHIPMILEEYFKVTTGQIPWLRTHFEIKRTTQSSYTAYKILKAL